MRLRSRARAALPAGLALGLLAASSAAALVPPYSFDTAYGRLPKTVVPSAYTVSVTPAPATMTFTGAESVILEFRQSTNTIILNSLHETLDDVRLDGKRVRSTVSNDEQQLTTIILVRPAAVGQHTLTFSYRGKMEDGPRGFFAQSYVKPDGEKGLLVSTKFESTDARRMFPCWDEPAFRATFQLFTQVPAGWTTISNMPIAKRTVRGATATTTFERTPKMPTYLLELTAGDFTELTGESAGTQLGVWAVRGQEQGGATALANAKQILADYDDYFGYPFPLPKLNSIAVPGGFAGAMENWGAITYNDQLLLVTPSSTLQNRQETFSVQAHEMAHQWNGDLVTMGWWDDIWLNESFASFCGSKETDRRNPTWNWLEESDGSKEWAMTADARVTSHAIQQHVTDELQVTNAFDPAITYSKGESVLRMLEAFLGPEQFRDGIRVFMKANAYSNANSTNLWNALSSVAGRDVGELAADWLEKPGFPLVSVAAACDSTGKRTVTLSQQRFLLQGPPPGPSRWQIPLQVRSGNEGQPRPLLLSQATQTVEAGTCGQPLTINAGGVGFFRSAFDPATLQNNIKSFATLSDPDRIVMLDDGWALVEAGKQPLAGFLELASSMGADLDERAWTVIAEVLTQLEYDERRSRGHEALTSYARSILEPVAGRLGWDTGPDETPGTQKLRRRVLGALGAWGDAAVIAEARRRFAAFLTNSQAIVPDDQEMVLSVVARNADAATFAQLHAVAQSSHNETEVRRFYRALMKVRDPGLAAQSAAILLSKEIPPQAAATRFQLVAELTEENPQLAWATFTQNHDMLMLPQGRYGPLITAQFAPELFWDSAPLDQLEAWVRAHVPAEMADNVARGMEGARFQFAEKTTLRKAADDYLQARATAH